MDKVDKIIKEGLPVKAKIIHVTTDNIFYLVLERKNWNRAAVIIITQQDANRSMQEMGIPISAQLTFAE